MFRMKRFLILQVFGALIASMSYGTTGYDLAATATNQLAVDLHRQLLQASRQPKVPDVIAEMASELAEDRRHGVGRERQTARRIESIDRLHETEARHLHEVVK